MLGIDWSALAEGLPAVQPLSQHQRHQLATVKEAANQRLLEMERESGMTGRLLVTVPRKEFRAFSALDEYHQWYIINDLVGRVATFWYGAEAFPAVVNETLIDN